MTTELSPLPAEVASPDTPEPGAPVLDALAGLTRSNSLSPSRASDFMSCPLLYRFRVIDRLPEAPSVDAVRGSVVHKVLEHLFDEPAHERTRARAHVLLGPAWEELVAAEPVLAELFGADPARTDPAAADGAGAGMVRAVPAGARTSRGVVPDLVTWLDQCRDLLGRYFDLEDPQRLEPAEREVHVATRLGSGLVLHGYIDRVDRAPTGELRIVDYKTGRSPSVQFEAKALFQMKFYALVVWRTHGVIPRMLQLVYLGNAEVLRYEPDEADLVATERKVEALWAAIQRAYASGEWRPNKSALCGWCDHQAICPAWGGTPPPLPEPAAETEPPAVGQGGAVMP